MDSEKIEPRMNADECRLNALSGATFEFSNVRGAVFS